MVERKVARGEAGESDEVEEHSSAVSSLVSKSALGERGLVAVISAYIVLGACRV